jgi:hypothetical protein
MDSVQNVNYKQSDILTGKAELAELISGTDVTLYSHEFCCWQSQ